MTSPVIYRSVESVLNVLNNHKNVAGVDAILKVYDQALKAQKSDEESNPNPPKHSLVVLEGLDGCGKSTIAEELVSLLNAARLCNQPESIKRFRHLFDDHQTVKGAYYALGNYIAALQSSVILKVQPVVMDRYWHSTIAYAVGEAVHDSSGKMELPPPGDSFYQWPEDLLKPSAVVFLNVEENTRMQRLSKRAVVTEEENLLHSSDLFRESIIRAYKNMVNPGVIVVENDSPVEEVVSKVYTQIADLLT